MIVQFRKDLVIDRTGTGLIIKYIPYILTIIINTRLHNYQRTVDIVTEN